MRTFEIVYILILLTSLMGNACVVAQCPTPSEFIKSNGNDGWHLNSQSRSGSFRVGESYEITFIAQRGMDYRISAASGTEKHLAEEHIELHLFDTKVEKIEENGKEVYKRMRVDLFEGMGIDERSNMSITTPQPRKLTIKVTVKDAIDVDVIQCVVVQIESRRSQKLGFN